MQDRAEETQSISLGRDLGTMIAPKLREKTSERLSQNFAKRVASS